MLFINEEKNKFNKAIKSKNIKSAFTVITDGYQTNKEQDMKLFELIENSEIFEVMEDLVKEGKTIPDKNLALASIYWNSKYFLEIGHGTTNNQKSKYFYLDILYEEKINDPQYARLLFVEWSLLFKDMVEEKTKYRDNKNTSNFYYSPHDYEEQIIEQTAYSLGKVMFKEATKEEIIEIILSCQNYPKKPKAKTEVERLYNIQNSRYYDVQYFSSWLSENALSLTLEKTKKDLILDKSIPLVSQGIINEIKIFHNEIEINKNLLEPQDQMLYEKLFEVRLIELLNDYQEINKEFLEIKNKNEQSPDNLLYTSLLEIRDMFENLNEKVNIKKIEELSFNVKLTREFIKHTF